MSEDEGMQRELHSFAGVVGERSASLLDTRNNALLMEMDEFFSLGKNTERIRSFMEDHDEALSLLATAGADDTNSEDGLKLYHLFQIYAALIEGMVGDFVASRAEKEPDVLASLVAAIQKEWNSSENAYRLLCTSYIATSLDYKSFLEFAEDLYGTMHYSVAADDDMESMESSLSGSGGGDEVDESSEKSTE